MGLSTASQGSGDSLSTSGMTAESTTAATSASVGSTAESTTASSMSEATTTTGVTTSDSSGATSGPSSTCGDANLDPGEECDDGNRAAGDGCSPLCHWPPTRIDFGAASETATQGGPVMGSKVATIECDRVLSRVAGSLDMNSNDWVCLPYFGCADPTLAADLSVELTSTAEFGPYAIPGPIPYMPWERECPAGHAIVGFGGAAGSIIDQPQFRCAPIEISEDADGFSIATGAVLELAPAGPDGGSPFGPFDCPANNVATGAVMDYGQWIFSLRLTCRPLLLAFD